MPHTISSQRLDLVLMTSAFMESVLAGDRARAEAIGGFRLAKDWPSDHDERFLRMRSRQIASDPDSAIWLARGTVLRDAPGRPMVGHSGFHGPPQDGSLEMGYSVFAEYQRRGIAFEAAEALMEWAGREHGIQRFVVSVSPTNGPSLALAAKMGFRRIGEQWDDEDGLEYVFESIRSQPGAVTID